MNALYLDKSGRITEEQDGSTGTMSFEPDTLMIELAADHEERICLLEMGVN